MRIRSKRSRSTASIREAPVADDRHLMAHLRHQIPQDQLIDRRILGDQDSHDPSHPI